MEMNLFFSSTVNLNFADAGSSFFFVPFEFIAEAEMSRVVSR